MRAAARGDRTRGSAVSRPLAGAVRRFFVGPIRHFLARAASAIRFDTGARVGAPGRRPRGRLELYEFEGCPYCRKVREALSILDLDALIRPCPKGGQRFRPELLRRGGKAQFPYLVDPDAGVELYESDAIVRHLFDRYGDGRVPRLLRAGVLTDATAMAASLARAGAGAFRQPARAPALPLELYGYEASPACRLVRERLSVLELPWLLHSRARGSRRPLPAGVAHGALPHLVDPNSGRAFTGASAILRHLDETWAD
jgi:glutathione S-transferase